MSEESQTIYLDEAGFTGENLLDPDQPFFVFASIAMDERRALSIRNEAVSRFRIQGNELKGSSLVKQVNGRKAVSWILSESQKDALVLIVDKKYALAGKFFEYIFEPVLAQQSAMFYAIGFHKFVATMLAMYFQVKDTQAEDMLRNFAQLMRSLNPQHLDAILSALDDIDPDAPLSKIPLFALCNRERIEEEINMLREMKDGPKWHLELSVASVYHLLAHWGEQFDSLDVYCDESKPIEADLSSGVSIFNNLIGRQDKAYSPIGKASGPSLVYNLANPINLVDSRNSPGVQIADVIASSIAYALKNPHEEIAKEWLNLSEGIIASALVPDENLLDLDQEDCFINSMVLSELVERSLEGESLLEGMADYILTLKLENQFRIFDHQRQKCSTNLTP